jgi:cyanoexosortase B-associated protein
MNLTKFKQPQTIQRWFLLLVLILSIAIGNGSSYLTGNWYWTDIPKINNINQIKNIEKTGLTIPAWKTTAREAKTIGAHSWLSQVITQDDNEPIMLLFLPQNYYLKKPEVEWVDINGAERWKTDSFQKLNFTITPGGEKNEVKARIFRAWNLQQTFAVVQWYAFPHGGDYSPVKWFWLDRLAQLKRDRVPWIAVCMKIPIEPLGDLKVAKPRAESLAKTVQSALLWEPFRSFI